MRIQSLPDPTAITASSTSDGGTTCWMNSPFTTSCSVPSPPTTMIRR